MMRNAITAERLFEPIIVGRNIHSCFFKLFEVIQLANISMIFSDVLFQLAYCFVVNGNIAAYQVTLCVTCENISVNNCYRVCFDFQLITLIGLIFNINIDTGTVGLVSVLLSNVISIIMIAALFATKGVILPKKNQQVNSKRQLLENIYYCV